MERRERREGGEMMRDKRERERRNKERDEK